MSSSLAISFTVLLKTTWRNIQHWTIYLMPIASLKSMSFSKGESIWELSRTDNVGPLKYLFSAKRFTSPSSKSSAATKMKLKMNLKSGLIKSVFLFSKKVPNSSCMNAYLLWGKIAAFAMIYFQSHFISSGIHCVWKDRRSWQTNWNSYLRAELYLLVWSRRY